ncbi:hypothetical protein N7520_003468 [Penicillium odoratum]|uniref:uncharacterized protein n=1 Tax=Penicillium odoratum TaxID=1167516 RepID=UPI0025487815|nr:uncharacterized protein N7520_003468 [Penicillium odoratum]KAJ5768909.1 hypothetical protein N7520_003468 [Penicillium odoratum]
MFLPKILLVAGILLDPTFIEKSSGQAMICTSSQILQQGGPTGCTCRSFYGTGQCATRCDADPAGCGQKSPAGFYLDDCTTDCTADANKDCEACGIWLNSVCECLQNHNCPQSSSSGSFWVRIGSYLMTTNVAIDNIVSLQKSHASLAPFGWDFGQMQYDAGTQGLAINPIHTISQDQIHMHICHKNPAMSKFLATTGSTAVGGYSYYSSLVPISLPGTFQRDNQPTTIFCQASQTPNTPISGGEVSAAINMVLGMSVCNYNVAAAVISDDNDYTWACVTADRDDAEHRFLVGCP